jgi:hypothetical protein
MFLFNFVLVWSVREGMKIEGGREEKRRKCDTKITKAKIFSAKSIKWGSMRLMYCTEYLWCTLQFRLYFFYSTQKAAFCT